MMPQTKRLLAEEVRKVKKTAKQSRFDGFFVHYVPGEKIDKHAFVVSKKIAKTAVERNTIRRKLYHAAARESFAPGKYVWTLTKPYTENIVKIARDTFSNNVQ